MAVDIEQISLPRVAVADVRQPLDIVSMEEERPEEDAGEGNAAAQPSGHRGIELGAPLRTQAFAQGVVDRWSRLKRPPGDDHEPHCRQDSQTERDPTDGRVDVTLADRQRCRGEEPVEGNERQLVDEVAEPEAEVPWARMPRPRWRQGEQRVRRHEPRRNQITDRHNRIVQTHVARR